MRLGIDTLKLGRRLGATGFDGQVAEIIAETVGEAYGLSLPATTESVEQGPSAKTDVAEVRQEVHALKAEFREPCLATKADVRAEFARLRSDLIR